MADYDVIIIGSGAGGLTAAVALAQAGQRVLVCEQHYVAGGWTHSFTLNGYRFSPGVHYIGGLGPGGRMRRIYEGLGVSGDLAFCELNPDGYDHVLIGRERFDIPKGKERHQQRLIDRFPHEAAGIRSYFETAQRIVDEIASLGRRRGGLAGTPAYLWGHRTLLRWFAASAQSLVDRHVSDPLLKAILLAQTGDHGLPPSQASAVVHAAIMEHYWDGGYYPLGGAFAIPRAFTRALKRAGGELRLETRVEQILLEDGRVAGVRLADGQTVRAPIVVSNADPEVTFGRLIGREHLSPLLRRKLDRVRYSGSALSLFFAVEMDLRAAGLDSGNIWYYRHPDLDVIYRQGLSDHALGPDPISGLFLTATTLKDPSKLHSGCHTLEAFAFVGYEPFAKWADGHRSEGGGEKPLAYLALKERLMDKMLTAVEEIAPGIREHVVFADLGTPLSNAYYLNATRGNLYGIAKGPFQVGPFAFPAETALPGLYLVGASTASGHGVGGATASGLAAARAILGCRTQELLQQHGPELPIYPSEDVTQWPAALRERIAERAQAPTAET